MQGAPIASKWVLLVLLLVYISNQWSRYLLNYLYAVSYDADDSDADKISLVASTGLTSAQYGLLVGYGFSFFYVIVGLFMGRAADIFSRKKIILYGLLIWNVAVVVMGMAGTFWQLLASRIVLGIGEAFSAPASYSLIADYFPASDRAEANGIYAFGVYVGGGLGSMSIAMARGIGWRLTCYSVAAYGFVLAVLVRLTVREPKRSTAAKVQASGAEDSQTYSLGESFRVIFSNRLIVLLFAAGAVRFMAGYAIGGFLPVFYEDVFPEYNTIYSYLNASVVSVGGALSSFGGGRLADSWERRGQGCARLYVPALGAALGAPFMALTLLSGNFYVSMFFLFCEYVTAECWFGPAISVLQNALPARVRGVGIASFTFLTTAAGSLTSWVLGAMLGNGGGSEVKGLLLMATCGTYAVSAALFVAASRHMPRPGHATAAERESLLAGTEKTLLLAEELDAEV